MAMKYAVGQVIANHGVVFDPFDGTHPYILRCPKEVNPPVDASRAEFEEKHDWVMANLGAKDVTGYFARPDFGGSPDEFVVCHNEDGVAGGTVMAYGFEDHPELQLEGLQQQLGVPVTKAKYEAPAKQRGERLQKK